MAEHFTADLYVVDSLTGCRDYTGRHRGRELPGGCAGPPRRAARWRGTSGRALRQGRVRRVSPLPSLTKVGLSVLGKAGRG